ncbi:glycosyltransferase family 2 protein [Tropicibacter naphthalenivorans]|uniref:Glycosyl transferase family 2 n=1 Tax=Tropicibacter naphthalenivorans TaxID=441103 RepID=A0A0P1GP25_9RHOB|nr:glycosyltransferase family 2 protein [Tropicibacter naphthalenivorans]CUH77027.1 hypothetical protein TRN7648_01255 [Tropicibacter naphthalenivorans]SMC61456.1 Glycosyl transferase family 2 [Tropicibacter naphthalenivorans]
MRITAVTCVKNEGPFLLEWIAYNRLIGVTDFLFYSNDCTDGTDNLLDALAARGGVVHLPNPARSRKYQMEALKDCPRQPVIGASDWVWVADVDEFLNIHVGDHTLPALIEACGNPQAISVTFQYFGNDAVWDFVDTPVIEQFTRSHNPDLWCADPQMEVKTLTRRGFPLQYFGAHRPYFREAIPKDHWPVWTDGAGRPVHDKFKVPPNPRRSRKFHCAGARKYATLNHYALRSLDSYLVKNDRGDVNRANRAFDDTYWLERSDVAYEDRSILRHSDALAQALAVMKSDPEIGRLHEECVARHRAKRDELLAQEPYRLLYDHLKGLPPYPPGEYALMQELGLA